jgi:hypothetical protein
MVITKKQHKFSSDTEESVLPPKTSDKNCIGTMNFISVFALAPPPYPLSTYPPGGEGSLWRIANILPLSVGGEWFGSTPKSTLFFSDYPGERLSLPSCYMQSIPEIASARGHGK